MITRQCVILIGGLGTRLGELTRYMPKPLLPVAGAPFVETLLREAARRGFNDVVLLASYCTEQVTMYLEQSAIAEHLDITIRISQEPSPMGTAGALAHAAPLLADSFLLLNGDTWFDFNWLDLASRAGHMSCSAAMALHRIEKPDRYETVVLTGSRVTAFQQRQTGLETGIINGGVYWLQKKAIEHIVSPTSLEAQLLPNLCVRGKLAGVNYGGFFLDIGIPDTYVAAQQLIPDQCRRPAVFLNCEGVLNRGTGYLRRPEEVVWIDGAKAAIKFLNEAGYYIFAMTDQVEGGHGRQDDFQSLQRSMAVELREAGAAIDDWHICPYHPETKSPQFRISHDWRKPKPGVINDLLMHWPIDLSRSFLIAEKGAGIAAANAAGIPGHLFQQGNLEVFLKNQVLAGNGA